MRLPHEMNFCKQAICRSLSYTSTPMIASLA